jgi:ABC-type multidrug transport system fused ATPase/permease subunit
MRIGFFEQNQNVIFQSYKLLEIKDRKKLIYLTILQSSLAILDLLGIIIIGIVTAQLVNPTEVGSENFQFGKVQKIVFGKLNESTVTLPLLAFLALFLLITKTLLSINLTKKILYFLGGKGAEITSGLVSRILGGSILILHRRSSQELIFSLTRGIELLTLQILATAMILISDFVLLVTLILAVLIFSPVIGLSTIFLITLVGGYLYRQTHTRALKLGEENTSLSIESNDKILEAIYNYREIFVRNQKNHYVRQIAGIRNKMVATSSEMNFLPYLSKFVFESAVIGISVLIGMVVFVTSDLARGLSSFAMILAVGSRLAPSALRIQQGLLQIRGTEGLARKSLELLSELNGYEKDPIIDSAKEDNSVPPFSATIQFQDVSFSYPGGRFQILTHTSFKIIPGSVVAVIGSSGSGKSTLVDLMLGILTPDSGKVFLSGVSPRAAILVAQGQISYVPQEIMLSNCSIRQNVLLGLDHANYSDADVIEALKAASFSFEVENLSDGLETMVGEGGASLSGGQRQRIGLARGLVTNPKLLVIDETTNAQDKHNELQILENLKKHRKESTIIVITHSTEILKRVDFAILVDNGTTRVLARSEFPNLESLR